MIDFLQGKWLKHPLHPVLVHVPTALWPAAWLFDLLSRLSPDTVYVQLAFYSGLLGMAAALLAIPTGIADWTDIRSEKPAWRLGLYHLVLNVAATILWGVNLWLRSGTLRADVSIGQTPFILSTLAMILLLISGYLGGRLIYAYGINVARMSKTRWREIARQGGAALPPEE